LTYFSRGVRAVSTGSGETLVPLAVLAVCAVIAFAVGATLLPRTD